ncbi:Digeranylgeranylglycerophospholipid reductase [Candidatus Methanoperedenaceae archaeon GB50]|nr:Digeranylgeranylglycerophospholipid reductase [Candidatus Methanoperedenaceae archaeon GB50]CAD7780860.1 MAG: Digeranylgeranylglycerophospholipid reductase [Candidatus Methanoperedenaceae archaeon GB50]
MKYDVVVVGAGPIGAIAARKSAEDGSQTLIIEEHRSIGSPVQCTGLISREALRESGLKPDSSFIYQRIRGANVYSPTGRSIRIDGGRTRAYVIDRKIFDRTLVTRALDAGSEIMLSTRATALTNTEDGAVLTVERGGIRENITAKVVIGADGAKSNISRLCGLGRVKRTLTCIQIEGQYETCDPGFVEIFLGNRFAPGFFAWAVPTTETIARIGLCTEPEKTPPHEHLRRLLREHPIVSKRYKGSCTSLTLGSIPLGALRETSTDGVIITGDAAGQVKPTTGGGIYPGAICAKIAGRVAARGDPRRESLQDYDRMWQERIGRELKIGMQIHNAIGKLSDERLDEFIHLLSDEKIMTLVREYGEMDHPSILFGKIASHLNKKDLFIFTGRLLKDLIRRR